MNSSPFSITLNLLLVAVCDSASDSKSVVESLLETVDDEEGDFLFLSISSDSELEDILSLLFLDFFFCLSTFLLGEGFVYFALPTTFSAGSSQLALLPEFTTGEIKFGWC